MTSIDNKPRDPLLSASPTNGRSLAARLRGEGTPNASQESLTTHPLLSPPATSLELNAAAQASSTASPTRYVPYTPRQRPTPTTSTTTHPSVAMPSSLQAHGGATSKLQVQSLKAAVQTMGLDNGSVGWSILEKLVGGDLEGPDWDEIWSIIAAGKATLLLPTEKVSSSFIATPEVVRDHVAFCNTPVGASSPLVTLSGIRGVIDERKLVLRSALPTMSKSFQAISDPHTRTTALSTLPPLPKVAECPLPYPTYALTSYVPVLPFPPRATPTVPPPLPPRPAGAAASRMNPFASLFGAKTATTPSTPISPPRSASPQPPPSIDSASGVAPSSVSHFSEGHIVSAFAVDHKIVKKDIGKAVGKALKAQIKSELAGLPSWIPGLLLSFASPLQPFSSSSPSSRGSDQGIPSPSASSITSSDVVDISSVHDTAESFQEFYESVEEELVKHWASGSGNILTRRSEDERDDAAALTESEKEHQREVTIRDAMDRVESCLTGLFYDQLFLPLASDDGSHDEALASRIAALNMLDLDLEHLGVEVDDEAGLEGIHDVVASCGEVLAKLQHSDHRSPKAKADLLVHAHKVVVEGLSRLPPVRLKPDGEEHISDTKTPQQQSFPSKGHENMHKPALTNISTISPPGSILHNDNVETTESPHPLSPHPAALQLPEIRTPDSIPVVLSPIVDPISPARSPLKTSISLSTPDTRPFSPTSSIATAESRVSQKGTTVNSDVLLPIIIFSVVKANPVNLVSHLLYVQRYRSRKVGGEESFCLINFLAVVEFLEHVDLHALGLGPADRVLSTEDLSPIPLANNVPSSPIRTSSKLRGRVEQQVGELTNSATKVISGVGGVVDTSFSALRGFLSVANDHQHQNIEEHKAAPWNVTRPGFGMLRRGASFSIAGVAASLPGSSIVKRSGGDEGRQMTEVPSRPGSVRDDLESTYAASESEASDDEGGDDGGEDHYDAGGRGDTRSIRSFSSMMSRETPEDRRERLSLADRLANMPALSRLTTGTPPGSRRSSLLPPGRHDINIAVVGSPPADLPRIMPPVARFLDCAEGDLKISEIPELLAEYRRVVAGLRDMGGFQDT